MKSLSEAAVRQYLDLGDRAPVPALTAREAHELRHRLETYEANSGALSGTLRHKPHLLFTWLNDLVRHPRILDAVEDIIGPDILRWGTSFFIKEKSNPSYVSWHQDSTYWGLEPPDIITAWVAFTDSTAANGAMRVIPGRTSWIRCRIAIPSRRRTCCRAARRSWWTSTNARRRCWNSPPARCRCTTCG